MKPSFRSRWARLATPTPQGQRGIALLLTLGVLSLLLVLAMSFAYTARTERQAAGNNADLVKARLLAESGMERVMALLRFASSSTSGSNVSPEAALYPGTNPTFFSSPTSGNWSGRRYMYSINSTDRAQIDSGLAVNFTTSSGTSYVFTPSDSSLANSGWIDILDTSSTGTNQPIAGRVSYVVIDQSGMIDPGAVVSTTNTSSTETIAIARTGSDPTEIQLGNLNTAMGSATKIDVGTANSFLTSSYSSASAPAYSRWFSMAHLAKSSVLTNTASGGRQNQWSVFTQALFPWSYDTDTYRLTPTSSDQPRYTLANAGSATVANLTSTSSGIPWLANLSPASVRDQVAANLIDYCDADDIATVPAGFSFSNSTTYVGLEKVPYINEVLITATLIENPGPPVSYSLDLTANCEMINIYDTNKSANFKMEVTFSNTSWQVSGSGVKTIPANFYRESGAYLSTYNPGGSSISLAVNKITVILTNSSTAYSAATVLDYTALETASPTLTLTSSSGTQCISVQVRDPRSNSNYSDGWEWGIWGSTAGTMMFAPYTNTNANPSGRAPNNDLETTGDPASNLSTAYIRNSRMLSLWELGAIHRGEAWRTLNLSKTTTGALSYTYTNGDANILDQVTLSTTATAATTVPIRGRFNVNSPQAEAWACFLTGVSVGQNYGDLSGTGTGTGTALTNANGRAITANANGIFEINGTSTSSSPITNRSGIAKWVGGTTRTTLSNNTVPAAGSQTTDRAQEEIIGKIADLLTVRSNYFTVIVTAQSVKDISAAVAGMTNGKSQADIDVLKASWPKTWIKYYDNDGNYNTDDNDGDWTDGDKWCDVLAEQKILAVVFRDAFTNTFVIKSFEYLNE